MPTPLKQSTQYVVRMGPFVDATDGVTPETGITLGAADQAELLKHTGATVDISAATWAAITGVDGWYDLTLTTSHTDTLGLATVVVQDSSVCLPVHKEFVILPANVFDSTVSTDLLDVNIEQVDGQNVTGTSGKLHVQVAGAEAASIPVDAIAAAELERLAAFVWRTLWADLQAASHSGLDELPTNGLCPLGLLSMLLGIRARTGTADDFYQFFKADGTTEWFYQTLETHASAEMITGVTAVTAGDATP